MSISIKKYLIASSLVIYFFQVHAQTDSSSSIYPFILQDTPSRLFSMRQFNQGYLSGYRMFARELNKHIKSTNRFKKESVSALIQVGLGSFFFVPLSHEEGHRSILTGQKIGSISRPFFNSSGAAYVIGVTDQTLIDLRDNDLPNYIRLHSGGLESDYLLTSRSEDISIFEFDHFDNLKYEYWIRKYAIVQYYASGLFGFDVNIEEEPNELDRDIVGYDTYGAARHLFRPDMAFYRYTKYDELSDQEKKFVTRMGGRSFLNLLNPLILGKRNFLVGEKLKVNAGMGYTLAPFGDFIDENIWLSINNKIHLKIYARQFQNRNNWFYGGGIGLHHFQLNNHLLLNAKVHFWNQPQNLDFNTGQGVFGGALETDLSYFFWFKNETDPKGVSIDIGTTMKTDGFLPEELFLHERIGIRVGSSLWF